MEIEGVQLERYNGHYYKFFNNSLWLLLFRQNSENCDVFPDKETAKYSTKNPKLYSILSKLNDNFKINSKYFEFILECINETYETPQINWWRQNGNPLELNDTFPYDGSEEDENQKLEGFTEIETQLYRDDWNGLTLTANNRTLLDGTPFNEYYYYAIGMVNYNNHTDTDCYIPTSIDKGAKECLLWVRLPQMSSIYPKIETKCPPCQRTSSILFTIFIYTFQSH